MLLKTSICPSLASSCTVKWCSDAPSSQWDSGYMTVYFDIYQFYPLTPVSQITSSLCSWTTDLAILPGVGGLSKKSFLLLVCHYFKDKRELQQLKPTPFSGISSALCGAWRYSLLAGQIFVPGRACVTSGVCIWWPGCIELAGDSKNLKHM